jgi:hypothetical protein
MNAFSIWFSTGICHILDLSGYDHLLFVSLLALSYPLIEWKKLLVLITAFTLGHSFTLALSVINGFYLPRPLIEFAIGLSILITALAIMMSTDRVRHITGENRPRALVPGRQLFIYIMTLMFGLLHGLAFSFLLRSMLDKESGITLPLLYFNLGIEGGQLIIVAVILLISLLLTTLFQIKFKHLKLTVVCIISLFALKICAERFLLLLA